MHLAKTLVGLSSVVAVTMASSRRQWRMGGFRYDVSMEGTQFCTCDGTNWRRNWEWNYNECKKLDMMMQWCDGYTEYFCQTEDSSSQQQFTAAAMASCHRRSKWAIVHQAPQSIEFGGLFCDCPDSGEKSDQFWTRIECNSLGKTLEWCYRRTQFVCNAEEQSSVFRTECLERGDGCQVHVC
ncbi:MAG: hypothetical protein J3Q66DRAFT_416525 [Benniella sp.]|nr:MAG: hypothetical protein J3Q66DRAFT_416525 [Benniella sp.]